MDHIGVDAIERGRMRLDDVTQARRIVWAVAAIGTALKLAVAATTFGTNDVHYWLDFVAGAGHRGPVGVYSVDFQAALYNHGPLTSWYLFLVSKLSEAGLSIPFLIRVPASLADLFSVVLLFELVRAVRGPRQAAMAATVLSLCPLSLVISGFHGNTDPVFVMFALLAVHRLWVRGNGLHAGLAIGLAISIKVIPVVLLPLMLVTAWRLGGPVLRRFVLGGALVFLALWAPALLLERRPFVSHYLGYGGIPLRQWGFSELLTVAGVPFHVVLDLGDSFRMVVVFLAAAAPALLARGLQVRDTVVLAGLPLVMLLVLTPAFSTQYLVWALAASLLVVPLRTAAPWVAMASTYVVLLYSLWNHALPWNWYDAQATPMPPWLLPLNLFTWLALVVVLWVAVRDRRPAVGAEPLPSTIALTSGVPA